MEPNLDKKTEEHQKEPIGALISIIVVVAIIFIGAYYFLKNLPFNKGAQRADSSASVSQ